MTATRGLAAMTTGGPIVPFEFDRREPGAHDVVVDIRYCGVCHSDIHQARDEWGGSIFPMVPGHEIIGSVAALGDDVERWTVGETVGVGVFVDSCRECEACLAGEEQYCENGMTPTYNGHERDGVTPTYGGYSERIVVDERYVLSIPGAIPPQAAAPLMCAGITTYSPIRHFGVRAGDRAAVVGLGGLGHMAVKFLVAFGAEVTVLSHSPGKRDDARRLGAGFVATGESGALEAQRRSFDLIIDTVSAKHDYNAYLETLRRDGTMVLVGLPDPSSLDAGPLVNKRRRIAGSMIGGIRETQEMLDLCAERAIAADVELIDAGRVDEAWERTLASDVRYRFVLDMSTLGGLA